MNAKTILDEFVEVCDRLDKSPGLITNYIAYYETRLREQQLAANFLFNLHSPGEDTLNSEDSTEDEELA